MRKMEYTLMVLLCLVGAATCNPASIFRKPFCFGEADSSESEPTNESESDAEDIHECLRVRPNDRGHVRVRKGTYLFYMLHRKEGVETDSHTTPLAIFLEGGPGKAVTGDANFGGIGPCNIRMERNKYAWTKHMHVLFIDSPVGVGFSYFTEKKYAAKTDDLVVEDLYLLLKKFYEKHNELRQAPLHIFGLSYGAKTAVQLAWKLEEKQFDCNLQSVTSLSGIISPAETILSYAPILLQRGFIDKHHFGKLKKNVSKIHHKLNKKNFNSARMSIDDTLYDINHIFGVDIYNSMNPQPTSEETQTPDDETRSLGDSNVDPMLAELMKNEVRKALHIKDDVEWIPFASISKKALKNFIYDSAYGTVKKLLQTKIKVNIVTGQHDFITSTAGTVKWVEKIVNSVWDPVSHDGKKRGKITIKQRLEGYFMKHERLTLYTVLRGGHSFPFENRPAMEWILVEILK